MERFIFQVQGDNWVNKSVDEIKVNLLSITFGGDRFVAVGENGVILTSANGGNGWDLRSAGTIEDFTSVLFGNGYFVLNGYYTYTSWDGILWKKRDSNTSNFKYINYYESSFLAIDTSNNLFNSTDGINWLNNSLIPGSVNSVILIDGKYTATGSSGVIYSSVDGINWKNENGFSSVSNLVFGNGYFLLTCDGVIKKSYDGIYWEDHFIDSTINKVHAYANGKFFAKCGYGGYWWNTTTWQGEDTVVFIELNHVIKSSIDGKNWTNNDPFHIDSNKAISVDDIVYGDSTYVLLGHTEMMPYNYPNAYLLKSRDGNVWSPIIKVDSLDGLSELSGPFLSSLFYANDKFYALGHTTLISEDAEEWKLPDIEFTGNNLATFGNGRIIKVGGGASGGPSYFSVAYSSNGINWNTVPGGPSYGRFYDVDYGSGYFVAVGKGDPSFHFEFPYGLISISKDGVNWDYSVYKPFFKSVVYGNGRFVVISDDAIFVSDSIGGVTPNTSDYYNQIKENINLIINNRTLNVSLPNYFINKKITMDIFNASGRKIKSKDLKISSRKLDISVSGLSKGAYFLSLKGKSINPFTHKFILD